MICGQAWSAEIKELLCLCRVRCYSGILPGSRFKMNELTCSHQQMYPD